MAQKEFQMSLRYSTTNEEQYETIKKAMCEAARNVYAVAVLVAGGESAKPDIKVFSDDFFEGKEELSKNEVHGEADKS